MIHEDRLFETGCAIIALICVFGAVIGCVLLANSAWANSLHY